MMIRRWRRGFWLCGEAGAHDREDVFSVLWRNVRRRPAIGEVLRRVGAAQEDDPAVFGFFGVGPKRRRRTGTMRRVSDAIESPDIFGATAAANGNRKRWRCGFLQPLTTSIFLFSADVRGFVVGGDVAIAGGQQRGREEHGETRDGGEPGNSRREPQNPRSPAPAITSTRGMRSRNAHRVAG